MSRFIRGDIVKLKQGSDVLTVAPAKGLIDKQDHGTVTAVETEASEPRDVYRISVDFPGKTILPGVPADNFELVQPAPKPA
jgi:hypothetical protein